MTRPKSRGFTITEIVMASLIVGLALIPIYQAFQQGSKAVVSSRLAYTTSLIAREIMEEARQVPFNKLQDYVTRMNGTETANGESGYRRMEGKLFRAAAITRDPGASDSVLSSTFDYPAEYKRFLVKLTLTDAGSPKLKRLKLQIAWQEHAGQNEKPRTGLSTFETILGYHSVDPSVFF